MNQTVFNDTNPICMQCGNNIAYIVDRKHSFLKAEYKFIQNKPDCFVKCNKMFYNGMHQFYYLTDGYRPLSVAVLSMNSKEFLDVAKGILEQILDIKKNGFLTCQRISISSENIFINPANNRPKLIYLPVSLKLNEDDNSFEQSLRQTFCNIIETTSQITSADTVAFANMLSNKTISVEGLFSFFSEGKSAKKVHENSATTICKLRSMDSRNPLELTIFKDDYLIGRKNGFVDGVIQFNGMIGRIHCKITKENNRFYIIDLKSKNGTFINGNRLTENNIYELNDGDVLGIATSTFMVLIRQGD